MRNIQFNSFRGENARNGRWFTYYNKWSKCKFKFEPWWYFDERPVIITNLTTVIMFLCLLATPFTTVWLLLSLVFIFIGWGEMYLHLPYNSGKTDECESPTYGFYFACLDSPEYTLFEYLYVSWGNKSKMINMPWSFDFYRRSLLLKPRYAKNGIWEHEYKGERKEFYKDEWQDKISKFNYNYTDSYDNATVTATISIEEMEWRRRFLMWTSLFNKVRRYIEVKFDKEVGSKKGSWKGGCIGCSYELLPDETPLDCIKRMEKERKF